MCIDCAEKAGYTMVPWPVGVWTERCDVCGKDKPTASLSHDFFPPCGDKSPADREDELGIETEEEEEEND